MSLYRLTTGHHPDKHYAVRQGRHGDDTVIGWVPRKGSAALFAKPEAAKLRRRLRKLAIRAKLEAA